MLDQAQFEGNERGVDDALERAAEAPRFDLHRGRTYLRMQPVLVRMAPSSRCRQLVAGTLDVGTSTEPTAEEWADVVAHFLELATNSPRFGLRRACDVQRNEALVRARAAQCIAVLQRLADEPAMADQSFALPPLIRWLGPADSAARREQLRQLLWLRGAMAELETRGPLARFWSQGEYEYFRSLAEAQGYWPPPPGWLPRDEKTRLLIVEGR